MKEFEFIYTSNVVQDITITAETEEEAVDAFWQSVDADEIFEINEINK